MECTYCGAELLDEGPYYLGIPGVGPKLGDTYRCPNHEGFEEESHAREYHAEHNDDEPQPEDWSEITCGSSVHRVSGSFYTDAQDNLHEGYPC